MHKLNNIFLGLFTFLLLSFVFISNSYAEFELGETISGNQIESKTMSDNLIPNYSAGTIYTIGYQYLRKSNANYEARYNQLLQDIVNAGYDYVVFLNGKIFILQNADFGIVSGYFYVTNNLEGNYILYSPGNENGYGYTYTGTVMYYRNLSSSTIVDTTISIKQLVRESTSVVRWDGDYIIELSPPTPDEPTFPTNQEIANAVQKFYDSDIYKNNNKFKDFLVIYYTHNQTFAFIGHTIGNNLEQVIVPPNVREQGKLYSEQWWHFKVNEDAGAPPFGTTFYLYTTTDFGENFQYDGSDTIGDLVNVDFSKNAVIVYSNYDYTVQTYVVDETTGDTTYTEGVIAGNEYTYDENLNPTENYYNPLDNFITVNPVEGIINDVDFNAINKVFEDSKSILNIENATWLFTANNQLINYFAGFITFIIILLAISRVLGG